MTSHDPVGPESPGKHRHPAFEAALTIGAVCGVLCIVAALSAILFGITPLVFRSGSMAPAIDTGSLAIGKEVAGNELAAGDVVSVDRSDGSRITHRVVEVQSVVGDSATIVLKGDANSVADPDPYVVAKATRVVADVPYLGYFVAWLGTPFAWITGTLLSCALLYAAFAPSGTARPNREHGRHRGQGGHSKHRSQSVTSFTAGIVLVSLTAGIVGLGLSRSEMTAAALSDTAVGNTASITAGSVTGPALFNCANRGGGVDLSFTINDARFTYQLTFTGGGLLNNPPAPINYGPSAVGTAVTYRPTGALLGLGATTTATLVAKFNSFVSAPLTRSYSVSLLGAVSCAPAGQTSGTSTQSARIAQAPAAEASTTPVTTTATTSPTTTAATTSPTTTTTVPPTTTTTAPPTTTTTTVPPTTTTRPPPPANPFIANGSSKTSGPNTASVADGQLTVTDGTGKTVYQRPVTTSPRYGTGIVWSSTGDLYALSDTAGPVRISPSSDGSWAASTVDSSALPADIAALV